MGKNLTLKQQADSGDVEAMYDYGVYLFLQKSDYETALEYFYKAASCQNELAYGEIGIILYRHKHDVDAAEKWFKQADEANALLVWAAYEYGMLILLEKNDAEKALTYLYKAAEESYELAYAVIGHIFYYYKKDIEEAEKWFKKAEKAKCFEAPWAYDYGMLLYLEKDNYKNAFKYLLKSAKEEYEPAFGDVASAYFWNKRDIVNAQKWFEKAVQANQLFPPNAYDYGVLFREKKDYDNALKYLLMAADQGCDLAYQDIAEIYDQMNDAENADKWYNKANEANI